MKKILYLVDDFGGGTGNHLASLINQLDTTKFKPMICSIVNSISSKERLNNEVPLYILPEKSWYDFPVIHQFHMLFTLWKFIKKHRPNIIHTYFFWSIIFGRLLKKICKIELLIENREDMGFNWERFEILALRISKNIPTKIIAVSELVRKNTITRESVNLFKIIAIHNGIDTKDNVNNISFENKREFDIADNELVVGMVSNLNREIKGVNYFIESIPQIVKIMANVKFLIVGEGHLKDILCKQAKTLGISDKVIFAGFRKDMDKIYSIMDISVLTSLSEGCSIAILESMKQALPLVVTNVGGNPEIVKDKETGYLVPPKDIASFTNRVVQLLKDKDLREKMGKAGRKRIDKYFNIDNVVRKYEEIYTNTIHQPQKPNLSKRY